MSFVSAHSPSPSCDSPSPSPSTSSHALPDAGQPPRKRSRSEMTSEERKEARAHRNRIAAQNSRDRRKAQFSWLERRVAELEEENRRLRAGLPVPPVPAPPPPAGLHIPVLSNIAPAMMPAPQPIPVLSPEDAIRASRDLERERENEELKERIKTLERGWDAVVKALAAQGLPTGLSTTPAAPTTASTHSTQPLNPVPVSTTPSTSTTPSSPPTTSPTTTTKPPISSATHFSTGFPSPAPSHASDFDFEAPVSAPSPLALSTPHQQQRDDVTARHSARVATLEPRSTALQRAVSSSHAAKVSACTLRHLPASSRSPMMQQQMMMQRWKTCSGRLLLMTQRRQRRANLAADQYKRQLLLLRRSLPPPRK
ncbi:hypothetical protein CC2G_009494 [Coprinopsis cinerea AmutBmut pab1-1]|nr:hypothetical protein CC2G_009494 [Coprinopsis cinerea AmutBmut pab1-1]